jgi:cytochrome c-type biogenesis protein CcmH/NrfF
MAKPTGNYHNAPRFSNVAEEGACPRCHGRSFKKASRRIGRNLLGGVGQALAAGMENGGKVECVTCGYFFTRG